MKSYNIYEVVLNNNDKYYRITYKTTYHESTIGIKYTLEDAEKLIDDNINQEIKSKNKIKTFEII